MSLWMGNLLLLFFLIAAPDNGDNVHLQVLSELSTLLMDHDFCEDLKNAGTPEEFLSIIDLAQSAKHEAETVEHPKSLSSHCLPYRNSPYLYGCRSIRKES